MALVEEMEESDSSKRVMRLSDPLSNQSGGLEFQDDPNIFDNRIQSMKISN